MTVLVAYDRATRLAIIGTEIRYAAGYGFYALGSWAEEDAPALAHVSDICAVEIDPYEWCEGRELVVITDPIPDEDNGLDQYGDRSETAAMRRPSDPPADR